MPGRRPSRVSKQPALRGTAIGSLRPVLRRLLLALVLRSSRQLGLPPRPCLVLTADSLVFKHTPGPRDCQLLPKGQWSAVVDSGVHTRTWESSFSVLDALSLPLLPPLVL